MEQKSPALQRSLAANFSQDWAEEKEILACPCSTGSTEAVPVFFVPS